MILNDAQLRITYMYNIQHVLMLINVLIKCVKICHMFALPIYKKANDSDDVYLAHL